MNIGNGLMATRLNEGILAAIRGLENKEWDLALRWSGRFVVHGTLLLSSRGLHEVATKELAKSGWQIISQQSQLHMSLLEPEVTSTTTQSTIVISRLVEKRFTPTILQPLQDEVGFMLATLGLRVEYFRLDRVPPTENRPARWGLIRRSGTLRSKALFTLQAEHTTIGNRFLSQEAWIALDAEGGPTDATFGPNDLRAQQEDDQNGVPNPHRTDRRQAQTFVAFAVLAAVTLLALFLPRPSPDVSTWNGLVMVGGIVVGVVILIGLSLSWLAGWMVKQSTSEALRSWSMHGVLLATVGGCLFALLLAPRMWLSASPLQIAGGAVAALVIVIASTAPGQALNRARRLRARQTPWLVLITSFGIVMFLVVLNIPTILFLWGLGDLPLVGSIPFGVVLMSGSPLVAAVLLALCMPAFARWLNPRMPILLALPPMIAVGALAAISFLGVWAWEGGQALAFGQPKGGLVLSMETSVCATIGDESAAPFWLLGTQGAAVHLIPRAVPGSDAPAGGLVLASADTRFVSVDADDDCS